MVLLTTRKQRGQVARLHGSPLGEMYMTKMTPLIVRFTIPAIYVTSRTTTALFVLMVAQGAKEPLNKGGLDSI